MGHFTEDSEIKDVFDLVVVGAGMFGCSAAVHASSNSDLNICLIGADEPETEEEYRSREIYSSHYDEGRIYQRGGKTACGGELAAKTEARLRELEELSGVKFCTRVGMALIYEKSILSDPEEFSTSAGKNNFTDITSTGELKQMYGFLNIDDRENYIFIDKSGGGYLNPRLMIQAEKTICKRRGCLIIDDVVNEITELQDGVHKIITERSGVVCARRVIVCAGAFVNFKKLLPQKLSMTVTKEMAAMLRVSSMEAQRFSAMPCLVMFCEIYGLPVESGGCYILPPILYPDGHYYLKIGHLSNLETPALNTLQEVKDWYNSKGIDKYLDALANHLMKIIPDLQVEEVKPKVCITCESPTELPYIDRLTDTLTVAAVGNSLGAMWCDEVGRLAAELSISGLFDSPLEHSHFRAILQ